MRSAAHEMGAQCCARQRFVQKLNAQFEFGRERFGFVSFWAYFSAITYCVFLLHFTISSTWVLLQR